LTDETYNTDVETHTGVIEAENAKEPADVDSDALAEAES